MRGRSKIGGREIGEPSGGISGSRRVEEHDDSEGDATSKRRSFDKPPSKVPLLDGPQSTTVTIVIARTSARCAQRAAGGASCMRS